MMSQPSPILHNRHHLRHTMNTCSRAMAYSVLIVLVLQCCAPIRVALCQMTTEQPTTDPMTGSGMNMSVLEPSTVSPTDMLMPATSVAVSPSSTVVSPSSSEINPPAVTSTPNIVAPSSSVSPSPTVMVSSSAMVSDAVSQTPVPSTTPVPTETPPVTMETTTQMTTETEDNSTVSPDDTTTPTPPTTQQRTTSPSSPEPQPGGLPMAAIIGIAAGGGALVLIIVIFLLICCCWCFCSCGKTKDYDLGNDQHRPWVVVRTYDPRYAPNVERSNSLASRGSRASFARSSISSIGSALRRLSGRRRSNKNKDPLMADQFAMKVTPL